MSQCQLKRRRTKLIGHLQIGHPLPIAATASAHDEQKRECPQGTRATAARGTRRHTSQFSSKLGEVTVVWPLTGADHNLNL